MTIHVVKQGDTLESIANTYGVSVDLLSRNNEISTTDKLVIGQTIVVQIPNQTHTIAANDSLLSIANQYGVSVNNILQNNPYLQGKDVLTVGDVLVISYKEDKLGTISVNGYAYPFIDKDILTRTVPYLTFVTVFTYGFTPAGDLITINDDDVIRIARDYGVSPIMLISTLTDQGTFNSELAHAIFVDKDAQNKLIDNILANLKAKNYSGLDIDFEYLRPEDRQAYVDFIQNTTTKLNAAGYQVIVSLAPKTSADQKGVLYEAHDYKAIGKVANAVLIMTYEWGNTSSPPMPVAPINKVKEVLDYAVTEIEPGKIFMGIPNYGYDWTLPYVRGTAAKSIGNKQAVELAATYNAEIKFDEVAQTPFFNYTDTQGIQHVVWFEDARSIDAKMRLENQYGFRGISYWNIMKYFPQNWLVVNALFTINKLI